MKKILIGTNNLHKIDEIRHILDDFDFVTPAELNLALDIDETGDTFYENALIKAKAFAQASGLPSLADDSGLAVDLLNGAPGVHSHRYSPKPDASDADRRVFLLQNLAGLPQPWVARFVSAAVLYDPETEKTMDAMGFCEGEVIPEERGTGGFGYDALFYMPDMGLTLAEMTEEQKNVVSHRGNAMRNLKKKLIAGER